MSLNSKRNIGKIVPVSQTHFLWKIPDFQEYPDMENYLLHSPPFYYKSIDWCLRMHTKGHHYTGAERIILSLGTIDSFIEEKSLKFQLSVLKQNGAVLDGFNGEHTFNSYNSQNGRPLSVDSFKAVTEAMTPDGCLTVSCILD